MKKYTGGTENEKNSKCTRRYLPDPVSESKGSHQRTAGGRTSGGDCRESDGERRHRDSGGRAQIET